jgi:hypothetical protein
MRGQYQSKDGNEAHGAGKPRRGLSPAASSPRAGWPRSCSPAPGDVEQHGHLGQWQFSHSARCLGIEHFTTKSIRPHSAGDSQSIAQLGNTRCSSL